MKFLVCLSSLAVLISLRSSADPFLEVATAYKAQVEPVFKRSCLDCHGQPEHLPWYFQIPGPKQLIEHDMKEAKEDIDMSAGFPFKGKGTMVELIDSLKDVLEDGSMPPKRYRMMHWDSAMTDQEKSTVLKWISDSEAKLSSQDAGED